MRKAAASTMPTAVADIGGKDQYKDLTYVSFEKVEGEYLPIIVHPDFKHIRFTYSFLASSFNTSMVEKTPFLSHNRVKKVFIKGFKSHEDEKVLDLLLQHTEERGGRGHCIQAPKGC